MTTIAYRDGVLAADTGMTVGAVLLGHTTKIVRRADNDMAGSAGDAAYAAAFLDWFMNGEIGSPPEAKEDSDYFDRGIIFRADGTIMVFEPRGRFPIRAKYYAFGSGREFAIGAMYTGANAAQAVLAAIAHDPHTNGDVTVLRSDL